MSLQLRRTPTVLETLTVLNCGPLTFSTTKYRRPIPADIASSSFADRINQIVFSDRRIHTEHATYARPDVVETMYGFAYVIEETRSRENNRFFSTRSSCSASNLSYGIFE